jgi:phytoene desaturase
MQSPKVAVIGSGIAALAAATRLAAGGFAVTVFEKNGYVGGKLGHLESRGYQFDRGPSLFTQAHLFEQHFTDCSRRREDYLQWEKLEEGTRYFWNDGTRLEAFPDAAKRAKEWPAQLGISAEATEKYLHRAADVYAHIGSIFLDQPISEWRTWLHPQILKALRYTKLPYLTQTLHQYNQRQLQHPKLVQLFDRFATYNGSDPYRCPAMLLTIAHLELTEGAYYPTGGLYALPQALRKLAEDLGVQFQLGTAVQQIVREGKMVKGVDTSAGFFAADAVVSNSDIVYTYEELLGDATRAQKWKAPERSSSGVVFYWGVKKLFPQLALHNILFAEDYQAEFEALSRGQAVYEDPTIYLNISSKRESAHAPAGSENWFILLNAPSEKQSAENLAQLKALVIKKLERMLGTDIASHIETEMVLDPAGIAEWTHAWKGALYGTASNDTMAAFRRHPNRSAAYPGVYFAGGTVHPGGGIPLCMRSGKLCADALMQDFPR